MTEAELKLKEAIKDTAKKDLEKWYQQRNSDIQSRRAINRSNETESNDSRNGSMNEGGNHWERITDLIDFQKATDKDTSRMRSILLSLKNAPATAAS